MNANSSETASRLLLAPLLPNTLLENRFHSALKACGQIARDDSPRRKPVESIIVR